MSINLTCHIHTWHHHNHYLQTEGMRMQIKWSWVHKTEFMINLLNLCFRNFRNIIGIFLLPQLPSLLNMIYSSLSFWVEGALVRLCIMRFCSHLLGRHSKENSKLLMFHWALRGFFYSNNTKCLNLYIGNQLYQQTTNFVSI